MTKVIIAKGKINSIGGDFIIFCPLCLNCFGERFTCIWPPTDDLWSIDHSVTLTIKLVKVKIKIDLSFFIVKSVISDQLSKIK